MVHHKGDEREKFPRTADKTRTPTQSHPYQAAHVSGISASPSYSSSSRSFAKADQVIGQSDGTGERGT